MDESYRNLYLQEKAKLKQKLENSPEPKSHAILIEDSSQPANKPFSQNTTIVKKSENTTFSGLGPSIQ